MWLELLRSPAVVDTLLLLMLLAWLGGSAIMTLRAGRGAPSREAAEPPTQRRGVTGPPTPGRSTMPPREPVADSLRP